MAADGLASVKVASTSATLIVPMFNKPLASIAETTCCSRLLRTVVL